MPEDLNVESHYHAVKEDSEHSKSKRFRFKSKDKDKRSSNERYRDTSERHRHHTSHHRRKRRRTDSHHVDDPSAYDDSIHNLPPSSAFRESLFDALGDDEGAAFWEGVYGQPIHQYADTYIDEETGELERMNDEEYAQFVRRKMWEKSWEGIEAAKEEKRREREQEKKRNQRERDAGKESDFQYTQNDFLFDFEVEASLKRGHARKEKKKWQALWQDYLQRWEALKNLANTRNKSSEDAEDLFLRNKIAWPVESGKRKDVNPDEIERFVKKCVESISTDAEESSKVLMATLKFERVRWHPDKIQQRFGFMNIDDSTAKGVTATFQVLDRLWSDFKVPV